MDKEWLKQLLLFVLGMLVGALIRSYKPGNS